MRYMLSVVLILTMFIANAQESKITDALLDEVCESIRTGKAPSDSARINEAFMKHLLPLFSKMDSLQAAEAWDRIFYRLQVTCPVFDEMMERFRETKGDWKTVDKKPAPAKDTSLCNEFKKHSKVYYLEPTGDTVHVTIRNGTWTESFIDGSYSKLKFYWVNKCEFHLEFISSNNVSRKNLSRPGDRYSYQVIDKSGRSFLMSAAFVGTERYSTFKIYY